MYSILLLAVIIGAVPATKAQDDPGYHLIKFLLYTNLVPHTPNHIHIDDVDSLITANYQMFASNRVIIHGWENDYKSKVNEKLRHALLDTGLYNVIVVDWSSASEDPTYEGFRNSVHHVGRIVAKLLDFLSTSADMSFDDLVIYGHSLGAHVAGYAGRHVTEGTVGTIYGLDPAYPLYSYDDCSTRLCNTDADYVVTIQTCGGRLGFLEPIGDAVFYPNGGLSQPGCEDDLTGACDHSRSYLYLAEAIRYDNFVGVWCEDYLSAVIGACESSSYDLSMAKSNGISGVYYVPVNSQPPYGMN